ncbi:unnamed protein product [Albugo candida]|uniref:Uncharacterized protein n=1 Tax=Albugo candida TaxID=65357 RepID=A0A024G7V4_9STRA|nr:unnamed protein product [Albugo candida]|eukprot:CCI42828.1 unnamed protein product [Albugo candida]
MSCTCRCHSPCLNRSKYLRFRRKNQRINLALRIYPAIYPERCVYLDRNTVIGSYRAYALNHGSSEFQELSIAYASQFSGTIPDILPCRPQQKYNRTSHIGSTRDTIVPYVYIETKMLMCFNAKGEKLLDRFNFLTVDQLQYPCHRIRVQNHGESLALSTCCDRLHTR